MAGIERAEGVAVPRVGNDSKPRVVRAQARLSGPSSEIPCPAADLEIHPENLRGRISIIPSEFQAKRGTTRDRYVVKITSKLADFDEDVFAPGIEHERGMHRNTP